MGPKRHTKAVVLESAPGLLEREQILASLEDVLTEARSERAGKLVLIGGEAGVGKTALVDTFCAAHAKSVRVLRGRCEPLRTPRPLGPLVDVADVVGGDLDEVISAGARPHEVGMALVRELQVGPPSVVVVEDVHWADEATLDVLVLLAGRIHTTSALVLVTYRDDELGRSAPFWVVLEELDRRSVRLKVHPLTKAGVTVLAALQGADADALYRATAGNPFFVVEALAAGSESIPETVRDAVLGRAARQSPPARRLLEVVAVVPGHAELWLLEALAGDLIDHLDECLACGMLSTGPAHVGFRHELARLAIEETIAPHRRLALNRAALTALSGRKADPARLAHHADAAGDIRSVLRWAPEAAERAAASGAHREAAAQYARALAVADALPDDQRAQLLQRHADECYLAAGLDEAIDAQLGALDCRRRLGDLRGEGDALRSLSRLLFFAGRTEEGESFAIEAVRLLEQLEPGHELAMAYANLSQRRMVVDDAAAAVRWGERALALGHQTGDIEASVYALMNIGIAQLRTSFDEGWSKLREALAAARTHNLEEYAGRAFNSLVMVPVRHRRFALVGDYLDDGLAYCAERGLDTWRLYLLACRARMELDLGRWDEAADTAALVLRDPRSLPVARSWALVALGLVRARRGDSGSSALLDEAQALVCFTAEPDRMVQVAVARAEAAWLDGDDAACGPITAEAFALALACPTPELAAETAYWRWEAGVRDQLSSEMSVEPFGLSMAGDPKRAAEQWRRLGCPYERALALAHSDDQAALRESLSLLQGLGAHAAGENIVRRLRGRGVRSVPRGPRTPTRENPAGLTNRELDVIALIAEGLRNSQIAERLVLSEKTVDHHVSAILRKLDARTRGEASAKFARLAGARPRQG